jgi:hypothetical protein
MLHGGISATFEEKQGNSTPKQLSHFSLLSSSQITEFGLSDHHAISMCVFLCQKSRIMN